MIKLLRISPGEKVLIAQYLIIYFVNIRIKYGAVFLQARLLLKCFCYAAQPIATAKTAVILEQKQI